MWRLPSFTVDDLESCSLGLRQVGDGATTMEEVASRLVRLLHDGLVDDHGERATALVRFYKTHRFAALPESVRSFAAAIGGTERLDDRTPCLTLLGSAGVLPEWCDRRFSRGHQAIPLPSPEVVSRLPMVSKLLEDMGLDTSDITDPTPSNAIRLHHRDYDVFYVPEAVGSPWVPAQDFVEQFGVRSVVGIGGVLPSGDMYAVIVFATVGVPPPSADLLKSLAPAMKAAVVRTTFRVFS